MHFMNNKKESLKQNEKDTGNTLMGKKHDDSRGNGSINHENDKKNDKKGFSKDGYPKSDPEKQIEITDDPEETEKKIPRMKN